MNAMINILLFITSFFFSYQPSKLEPEFRELLEPKSTLIENNKKEKYSLLKDSNNIQYKVRWNIDEDYPGLISLLIYKDEHYSQFVSIGNPLQFHTGSFLILWINVA